MKDTLRQSAERVQSWVEDHDYKGYEPFDGNASFLRGLTFGNWFLERVLQQAVLRTPFNVRPLLGIRPLPSTKGRGYMAWGYLAMLKLTGDDESDRAVITLAWRHLVDRLDTVAREAADV